jgi:glucose-1-phosphate thymidylyltransferase
MHAFILAGGFATRLWPLTEARAKPLLPLAGKPLLSHIIENIPAHIPVTVSTNAAFGTDMQEWQKTIKRTGVDVHIEHTRNDDEKLGTLGATAQWIGLKNIKDDILLLTGDNYFGFDMNTFIAQYKPSTALVAAYDVVELPKASAFGTIILKEDGIRIDAFEEKPKEPKSSLVSTGCSILPLDVIPDLIAFAKVKPDNVGGIFEELLRLGKTVECFRFTEPWFDIGSFEAYLEATKVLVGDHVLKTDKEHMKETMTEGSVVIGAGCNIQSSTLRDTVIFEHCIIDDCVLERCIIDDNCELRGVDLTGKMIRAGTVLVK